MQSLSRRCAAEALGTAFLLVAVVGSGIMAERLFPGQVGLALLANAVATGAALVALILALADVSGAHFNPIVTLHAASRSEATPREAASYLAAQTAGAIGGVLLAHAMFGEPLLQASSNVRAGAPLLLSELVATFGLVLVVGTAGRRGVDRAALAVGGYIAAAYWFTPSTSFANPAVTVARCLTDTFAGIRPEDAPGFVLAQIAGGALAALVVRWLPDPAPREETP